MSQRNRSELTQQQREYCFEIAQAVIAEQTPAILRRWRQIGRDLLDDARSEIWRRIERGCCDPSRGEAQVRAWCCTVLRNLLYSLGRKVRRISRVETIASVLSGDGGCGVIAMVVSDDASCPAVQVEQTEFLTARFSEPDLALVRSWRLSDRIELLCLSDLWRKVPDALWRDWVLEHRAACGTPVILPTKEVLDEATPQDRMSPLAKALGVRSNSLSQRWHRKQGYVKQLHCIADLNLGSVDAR